MARVLTASMITAVAQSDVKPVLLIEAQFDSGTLYLATGYGTLTIDGNDYIGTGDLLSISAVRETTELEAVGATLILSGITSELLAIALNENFQDRPILLKLGLFDSSWALISDPLLLFEGRMDTFVLEEAADKCSITVNAENVNIDLLHSKILSHTPEDQALFFPGDTGFDFVASLQEKEISLGN